MKFTWILPLLLIIYSCPKKSYSQHFSYPKDNPVELGKVKWFRNYDSAKKESTLKNLPILILFQEVPGCSNCTKFGNDILSHPLVVEAMETFFVPLCIYNNHTGADKIILEKFGEPSWNNPVIRVIGRDGKDIVPRQADFRSISGTIGTLIEAIKFSDRHPPEYLKILLEETEAKEKGLSEVAYFSMYCFWSGEKEIAGLTGVIATEAGYMDGKEVVKVSYRADKTLLAELFTKANKVGSGDNVYASVNKKNGLTAKPVSAYKKDNEDKYYLIKSPYKVIPMTELQKTKVNRAIGLGHDPAIFLSPWQIAIINHKKITKNQVSEPIEKVWWKM